MSTSGTYLAHLMSVAVIGATLILLVILVLLTIGAWHQSRINRRYVKR